MAVHRQVFFRKSGLPVKWVGNHTPDGFGGGEMSPPPLQRFRIDGLGRDVGAAGVKGGDHVPQARQAPVDGLRLL